MRVINHPDSFKSCTRVLMRKGRAKDGIENRRTYMCVTNDSEEFDDRLRYLVETSDLDERIYASAGDRDVAKAVRRFKGMQLDNDYEPDPLVFYQRIHDRWISALMKPASEGDKRWLFDCDEPRQTEMLREQLPEHYNRPVEPYWYDTKNGRHCVLQPFNVNGLDPVLHKILHKNGLMLWAY